MNIFRTIIQLRKSLTKAVTQRVFLFLDGKKRLFHKTRIIIGKPYTPVYTGRRGTAEEMQNIADDLLREIYALGGQQVGGAPL